MARNAQQHLQWAAPHCLHKASFASAGHCNATSVGPSCCSMLSGREEAVSLLQPSQFMQPPAEAWGTCLFPP